MRLAPLMEIKAVKPLQPITAEILMLPSLIQKTLQPEQNSVTQPQRETVKPEQPVITKNPPPLNKPSDVLPVLKAENFQAQPNDYAVPDTSTEAKSTSTPSPVQASESKQPSPVAKETSSSSKAESTSLDDESVLDEYGRSLQKLCERYKQYPAIAIRRNWQGSGKVLVRFSAEGKTLSIVIESSTGQKVLDEQALEMVRKSINDLPVPAKFKGREFRILIPVDFRLE